MGDLMDNQSLIDTRKMVTEIISDQVPKLIVDQFDRPPNVRGKTEPYNCCFHSCLSCLWFLLVFLAAVFITCIWLLILAVFQVAQIHSTYVGTLGDLQAVLFFTGHNLVFLSMINPIRL